MLGSPDHAVPVLTAGGRRARWGVAPALVAAAVAALALLLIGSRGPQTLTGAGSTLAAPLIERAARDYRDALAADDPQRPAGIGSERGVAGPGFDYEPVGSLGGVMRLADPEVDFAVTDYPLSAETLHDKGLTQFPIAVGAVALVHDLDLPPGQHLRLDAQTVADIYQGRVTRWDDPALARLNPGLDLPATPIVPVHRTDGSGSTAGLTGWLTRASGTWAAGPGAGPAVTWPDAVGQGAERSSGLIAVVAGTPGALGYAEPAQARAAGLQVAQVASGPGWAAPSQESMAAAVAGIDWAASADFTDLRLRTDAAGAYPLTVPVHVAMRREPASPGEARRVLALVRHHLDHGQDATRELGLLPLPPEAVDAVTASWQQAYPGAV